MSGFISENFLSVQFHIKERKDAFQRFGAQWTPTQLILDPDGVERHRMEGFFGVDDFLAQMELGLAKIAFQNRRYDEAEKRYGAIYQKYANSGASPEAMYWEGVARYKATNDGKALGETGRLLRERFPDTEWARKGSVWL